MKFEPKKVPEAIALEAKADQVVEEARLNEAIRVIDRLLGEVDTMPMPSRFDPEKKPSQSVYRESSDPIAPRFKDLNEPEYKRTQLRQHLESVKAEILRNIGRLHSIVLDIEATKTEG